MSLADMIRVCVLSGSVIMVTMVLLGAMMIAQKPEARLVLAAAPEMPVYSVSVEETARSAATVTVADASPTAKAEPAS